MPRTGPDSKNAASEVETADLAATRADNRVYQEASDEEILVQKQARQRKAMEEVMITPDQYPEDWQLLARFQALPPMEDWEHLVRRTDDKKLVRLLRRQGMEFALCHYEKEDERSRAIRQYRQLLKAGIPGGVKDVLVAQDSSGFYAATKRPKGMDVAIVETNMKLLHSPYALQNSHEETGLPVFIHSQHYLAPDLQEELLQHWNTHSSDFLVKSAVHALQTYALRSEQQQAQVHERLEKYGIPSGVVLRVLHEKGYQSLEDFFARSPVMKLGEVLTPMERSGFHKELNAFADPLRDTFMADWNNILKSARLKLEQEIKELENRCKAAGVPAGKERMVFDPSQGLSVVLWPR